MSEQRQIRIILFILLRPQRRRTIVASVASVADTYVASRKNCHMHGSSLLPPSFSGAEVEGLLPKLLARSRSHGERSWGGFTAIIHRPALSSQSADILYGVHHTGDGGRKMHWISQLKYELPLYDSSTRLFPPPPIWPGEPYICIVCTYMQERQHHRLSRSSRVTRQDGMGCIWNSD